jgi:hypothetical protein
MHSLLLQLFALNTSTTRLLRHSCLSLTLVLALAAFLSTAWAQVSPPPDGGYPGANTAEGDAALSSLTTGEDNTALGFKALAANTTGGQNTATGERALRSNTTGGSNTATGLLALTINSAGNNNTATGVQALFSNTADNNTATGASALANNTTGSENTADGLQALYSNTTGADNTATGVEALLSNTEGGGNTAMGRSALRSNTTGDFNTANGFQSLFGNTTGTENTATGFFALANNTTGQLNTATGRSALGVNTTGQGNTATGAFALRNSNGNRNTAIGQATLLFNSGDLNIALGDGAGGNLTTGSNNIDIGNTGVAGESATIRIGKSGTQTKTFVAGINGAAVTGSAVKVNAAGQLGTAPSSKRFKNAIKPMDKASEAILALRPVTFRYKQEVDPDNTLQFGLVAEEVVKINPDLVTRDEEGKVYTVRYEAVNAMLLNEFLKEHKTVQAQQATITRLEKQVEALTAGLQKVSAAVELNKSTPTQVANSR